VNAKSPSGRDLFIDDLDRQRYRQLLAREVREREWSVLTYCQMTNHLHALVRTPSPDLGAGFKRIHEDFAQHINRRHLLGGHLFGARFHSKLVRTDGHLVGCLRYIARNPVEACMCSHAREWPWSAHRALAGLAEPPRLLDVGAAYEFLGGRTEDARTNYLQLVAKSNLALLADLERPDSDTWLLAAVDDFSIPICDIAEFLRIGVSTTYRRLAAARENEGSVPSVSGENEGSVPSVSAEG
jgi:REP element-mobilizing transposase RayT